MLKKLSVAIGSRKKRDVGYNDIGEATWVTRRHLPKCAVFNNSAHSIMAPFANMCFFVK